MKFSPEHAPFHLFVSSVYHYFSQLSLLFLVEALVIFYGRSILLPSFTTPHKKRQVRIFSFPAISHIFYLLFIFLFSIFRISTASASLPDTYTALPAQTPELPASSAVCHSPPSYVHIPELRHNILPGILYLH